MCNSYSGLFNTLFPVRFTRFLNNTALNNSLIMIWEKRSSRAGGRSESSELRQGGVTVTRVFPSETHCTEAVAQSARVRNLWICISSFKTTYYPLMGNYSLTKPNLHYLFLLLKMTRRSYGICGYDDAPFFLKPTFTSYNTSFHF